MKVLFHYDSVAEHLGEMPLNVTEFLDATHGVEHLGDVVLHFGTCEVGVALLEFFIHNGVLVVEQEAREVGDFQFFFALLHLVTRTELVAFADEVGGFAADVFFLIVEQELAGFETFFMDVLAGESEHLGVEWGTEGDAIVGEVVLYKLCQGHLGLFSVCVLTFDVLFAVARNEGHHQPLNANEALFGLALPGDDGGGGNGGEGGVVFLGIGSEGRNVIGHRRKVGGGIE